MIWGRILAIPSSSDQSFPVSELREFGCGPDNDPLGVEVLIPSVLGAEPGTARSQAGHLRLWFHLFDFPSGQNNINTFHEYHDVEEESLQYYPQQISWNDPYILFIFIQVIEKMLNRAVQGQGQKPNHQAPPSGQTLSHIHHHCMFSSKHNPTQIAFLHSLSHPPVPRGYHNVSCQIVCWPCNPKWINGLR